MVNINVFNLSSDIDLSFRFSDGINSIQPVAMKPYSHHFSPREKLLPDLNTCIIYLYIQQNDF